MGFTSYVAVEPITTGLLGDGSDGAVVLDGTTAYPGSFGTPSVNVYTQLRDTFTTSLVINAGVTLIPANYRIFCQGVVVNNGTISAAGNNAAGSAAGTNLGSGSFFGGRGGGAGGTGANGAGGNGGGNAIGAAGGAGGAGTSGAAGSAGPVTGSNIATLTPLMRNPFTLMSGEVDFNNAAQQVGVGCGGGGGGSDAGSHAGGGGGGGGGVIAIWAQAVQGTGSMTANGGNGAAGSSGNAGGGGGGSAGLVCCYTPQGVASTITQTAAGGALGAGVGTGSGGVAGGAGLVLNVTV